MDAATLQPADITQRQPFWITVHVPADAEPGVYSGLVKVLPQNAPTVELTLEVTVHPFDLLAPPFEYSIYYPAFFEETFESERYIRLTEAQYLAELRDMVAHGCTNPVFYQGVYAHPDGSLDFFRFSSATWRCASRRACR